MSLQRAFVRMRSCAPGAVLALAIALGQGIAWFLSVEHLTIFAAILSLFSLMRLQRIEPIRSGLLVGLITGAIAGALQIPTEADHDTSVLVQVEDEPRHYRTDQVVFLGRDLLSPSRALLRCSSIDLPWRNVAQLRRGSVVWIRGPVVSVARPLNPFSWDGWLWRSGVTGTVKVRYISTPLEQSQGSPLHAARQVVAHRVRRAVGEVRGGELLLSMAFGYRDLLSTPVEEAFRALGLTHLLVVSGYQVSLVFGVFFWLASRIICALQPSRGARLTATGSAISAAVVFVAFIGAELSALRALVAAACVCATHLMECAGRFAQRWGVALLIVELLSPWALFDVGVQLTFAALLGIGIGARLGRGRSGVSFIWVSICAWILTSTVMLAWNGTLSLIGLPLNILLAVPWSFLNCVVGGCGVLALMTSEGLGGEEIVWLVSACNELVVSLLLRIAESPVRGITVDGIWRAIAIVIGVLLTSALGWRASAQPMLPEIR